MGVETYDVEYGKPALPHKALDFIALEQSSDKSSHTVTLGGSTLQIGNMISRTLPESSVSCAHLQG